VFFPQTKTESMSQVLVEHLHFSVAQSLQRFSVLRKKPDVGTHSWNFFFCKISKTFVLLRLADSCISHIQDAGRLPAS